MLRGDIVHLRRLKASDLDELVALIHNIPLYHSFIPENYQNESSLLSAFQQNSCWSEEEGIMLIEGAASRLLGIIAYKRPMYGFQGLEVSAHIYKKRHRDSAILQESLQLFSDFLMQERPINRLQTLMSAQDKLYQSAIEKAGFRHEGCFKEAIFFDGQYSDMNIYALLRKEWTVRLKNNSMKKLVNATG